MCGIAGFIKQDIGDEDRFRSLIEGMVGSLMHRGPDSQGIWTDVRNGVALGHARLSIIDLSSTGHQPMVSASGRTIIVYNGEIYNYREIANELAKEGVIIRGQSDTEVILEAIELWGIEKALRQCNGMFALALWDVATSRLTLARDRIGVKPLYYGWIEKTFVFASELKAIEKFAAERLTLNTGVLDQFLRFGYIPTPQSIYQEIAKLPAGNYVHINEAQSNSNPVIYWSVAEVARKGGSSLLQLKEEEIIDELESLLTDAVRLRLVSDVPLGAFLSGGVDSSLVVALMQQLNNNPVRTFSIGFTEEAYNEAHYARAVAKHLGTLHTDLIVNDQDIIRSVLQLPNIYDEPFADSSQLPTYLVSELTRRHVTVSLSGDGADEFFGGYPRYQMVAKLSEFLKMFPYPIRSIAGTIAEFVGGKALGHVSRIGAKLLSLDAQSPHTENLFKLPYALKARTALEMYDIAIAHWTHSNKALIGKIGLRKKQSEILDNCSIEDQMMCIDQQTYLPDGILVKVDRASMAVGLEAREPLLDYRLMEYAWRIPLKYKINGNDSKIILKKILVRHIPSALINRPKMGFGAPIGYWIRGILKDWAADLLDPTKMAQEGIFNVPVIQEKWQQHLKGVHNWQYPLWDILMFQAWKRARG